jgi:hypothetical protein
MPGELRIDGLIEGRKIVSGAFQPIDHATAS